MFSLLGCEERAHSNSSLSEIRVGSKSAAAFPTTDKLSHRHRPLETHSGHRMFGHDLHSSGNARCGKSGRNCNNRTLTYKIKWHCHVPADHGRNSLTVDREVGMSW